MTRTTRRYLIARLTQLGGNRRTWGRWIKRCYARYYGSIDSLTHQYNFTPTSATSHVVADARNIIKFKIIVDKKIE